ncbi:MAG: potassium channel family protein [Candidatus Acetothermia bacterium]
MTPRPQTEEFKSLLIRVATALALLIFFGTVGYVIIEDWGLFDAFYMVIITITTTGYGELQPLSTAGRILSMGLMVTGIGVFFYGLNSIIPILVGLRIERWKRMLEDVEEHYLVCGFGDMGQEIAGELSQKIKKTRIVVVDPEPNRVSLAREKGYIGLQGQPSDEDTLSEAGIKRAKAIVATMDDSTNAFTVMVAKDLNPEVYSIGIAQSLSGSKNIKRAGADYVLSPYVDTAKKTSTLLRNPIATDLTEIIGEIAEIGLLQRVSVKDPEVSGKSLKNLDLTALVIAMVREGEIIRPTPDSTVQLGDNLYMIGDEAEVKAAREILIKQE